MDIGFYLIDCNNSPKNNDIIDLINNFVSEYPYDNVILFNNTYQRIDIQKKFPILHLSQAKYFYGTLIMFDIKSAILAKNFPGPSQIIVICDDTEWLQNTAQRAMLWKDIYEDKNITFITSNKLIKDLLEICWNINVIQINSLTPDEVKNALSAI